MSMATFPTFDGIARMSSDGDEVDWIEIHASRCSESVRTCCLLSRMSTPTVDDHAWFNLSVTVSPIHFVISVGDEMRCCSFAGNTETAVFLFCARRQDSWLMMRLMVS